MLFASRIQTHAWWDELNRSSVRSLGRTVPSCNSAVGGGCLVHGRSGHSVWRGRSGRRPHHGLKTRGVSTGGPCDVVLVLFSGRGVQTLSPSHWCRTHHFWCHIVCFNSCTKRHLKNMCRNARNVSKGTCLQQCGSCGSSFEFHVA